MHIHSDVTIEKFQEFYNLDDVFVNCFWILLNLWHFPSANVAYWRRNVVMSYVFSENINKRFTVPVHIEIWYLIEQLFFENIGYNCWLQILK